MPKVLVVRASYRKAYSVIESLKKAGYTVVVGIDSTGSEAQFSIFRDKITRIVNPYNSEKRILHPLLML
jgi:rhodanese-related sulfurtransferase